MSEIGILKRLKNFIKYHIGPKEVTYDSKLNNYMPNNMLDLDCSLYVIKYNEYYDSYTMLANYYKQEMDV